MVYVHGRPWFIVTMVDHGLYQCSTMVDCGAISQPWSTMVIPWLNEPFSTMVDHGRLPWFILQGHVMHDAVITSIGLCWPKYLHDQVNNIPRVRVRL